MNWAAKVALAPCLLWQGARVRRAALRLPEAAGPRQGLVGDPHAQPKLRLLVVGDSSAAGVGVASQSEALAEPLAAQLAQRLGGPVSWQLLACTGYRARDACEALRATPDLQTADVMLAVLGVNDITALAPAGPWLRALDDLHGHAQQRAGVRRTWHTAMPPMGRFPLLPQPLRWVLGQEAARLDQALKRHLSKQSDRRLAELPPLPAGPMLPGWMAEDGFHPGHVGYRHWAAALADQIAGDLPG